MSVKCDGYEYTFYINHNGEWTMHVFDLSRSVEDGQWIGSYYNVSWRVPELRMQSRSTVTYNAWE